MKRIGLVLGPSLAAVMMMLGPPEGLTFAAWATGALMVWMAIWWATEPIPIPVTSLLPMVVLPLVGAGTHRTVVAGYSSHIVMLLLGGFIIALAIERWNLHKRIALEFVSRTGPKPRLMIFGFMIATALLSMWISNTATTLMMVPIALSAAVTLKDESGRFVTALLLGICYAASIGGVATPIGTPTNLIAIDWLQTNAGAGIGFPQWMMFGIPAMLVMIPVAWWTVTRDLPAFSGGAAVLEDIRDQKSHLGPMTTPEARVAIVFACVATLWILRLPINNLGLTYGIVPLAALSDMGIAIAGAVTVFLVPAGKGEGRALMNWEEAVKLPWGVLLLFGGGIALGNAVKSTGMSEWVGLQLQVLSIFPLIIFVGLVVALVIFLTELTSNVATMTTLAPILGALAVAIGAEPSSLLAPAAVAASCAFMLPVATAPNAIVYATGEITVAQMMRKGLTINLMGVVIITVIGYWLAPLIL
ncbi:MAG: SLC13 family permease [Henriciella sp.]|nr:SLC13 family permease [Henriciella sp.]